MIKQVVFPFIVLLFACRYQTKQATLFLSESDHYNNLKQIHALNSQMLKQLKMYGVNAGSGLSLDFYYVTNDSVDAQHLSVELEKWGYHANRVHRSSKDQTLWVVSASSSRVNMDSSSLNTWTDAACELGYKNDCRFQGWSPVTE